MIDKEYLLRLFKKETATTLKVMRAFPEDKLAFKPHERSSDALKIMSTFVFGMYLINAYVFGESIDRLIFKTYFPDKLSTLITDFEKASTHVIDSLERMSDTDMRKSVEFAGSKSSAGEFMFFMLQDQIHHRRQMSVYIRLAGGKVPSVYGPTADDPSTNL